MAMLISSWSKDVQSLPEPYILPPSKRPGELIVPATQGPLIDLNHDRSETIRKFLEAGKEFGFFQVINHGVSESLMEEAIGTVKEFFEMTGEMKESSFTADSSKRCRLYTSSLVYENEKFHYWRDNLTHPCHPLEDCQQLWPKSPTKYREVVGKYTVEARKLIVSILDLIEEGLGLEDGYFGEELSRVELLSANHYPRCPEPSLTMGMASHCDPNLLTLLLQGDQHGLQVFKDGQWIGVEPHPHAFVVILGCQLQIISNEKLKSAEHRVVTSSEEARTTVGYFIIPSYECLVEPAGALLDVSNPPLYKPVQYKQFLASYDGKNGEYQAVMNCYKLQL
ncbi:Hyoscyamine (6S)-dioxygenase [Bertholletia excelsa]